MSQQAQIDALEHLLIAVLKKHQDSLFPLQIFLEAEVSLLGVEGPIGDQRKDAARRYLVGLQQQFEPPYRPTQAAD